MIKVLMISADLKILEEGTEVRARMAEYGKLFKELHIVIATGRSGRFHAKSVKISDNTFVYPTRSSSKLFFVRDAIRLSSIIARNWAGDEKNCVITCQDPFENGLVGKKISEKFGIPLHIQIHTDFLSPYFVKGSVLNRVRLTIARKVLPHAQAIRVVSEKIRRSVVKEFVIDGAKIRVLPIFADFGEIREAPAQKSLRREYPRFEKIVLMASRITKEKDFVTALRAFALVEKKIPKAGLVIFGAGHLKTNVMTLASRRGIARSVIFRPWADRNSLISYMKTSDVFLSTSLYEGYGLSMAEAFSAGIQLVATDAGIASELTEFICEPRDFKCLAKRLEEALSGKNGRKTDPLPELSKEAYLEAYRGDIFRAVNGLI